jgi:hypothetical protein
MRAFIAKVSPCLGFFFRIWSAALIPAQIVSDLFKRAGRVANLSCTAYPHSSAPPFGRAIALSSLIAVAWFPTPFPPERIYVPGDADRLMRWAFGRLGKLAGPEKWQLKRISSEWMSPQRSVQKRCQHKLSGLEGSPELL